MLINNFAKLIEGSVQGLHIKAISEMINGNIFATTYMTRFILNKKKNNKIAIINVGDAAAYQVNNRIFKKSRYQIYQATLPYQLALTDILEDEYRGEIDFMNDLPYQMGRED